MLPEVMQPVSVEMIRDGGSWAATFVGDDGNTYMLSTEIRSGESKPAAPGWELLPGAPEAARECFEKERLGHAEPVLFHTWKRPADTPTRIYSNFAAESEPVSWEYAKRIMSAMHPPAEPVGSRRRPFSQEWLEAMTEVVNREGQLAPGAERFSRWYR